jgi:hypothetical protein
MLHKDDMAKFQNEEHIIATESLEKAKKIWSIFTCQKLKNFKKADKYFRISITKYKNAEIYGERLENCYKGLLETTQYLLPKRNARETRIRILQNYVNWNLTYRKNINFDIFFFDKLMELLEEDGCFEKAAEINMKMANIEKSVKNKEKWLRNVIQYYAACTSRCTSDNYFLVKQAEAKGRLAHCYYQQKKYAEAFQLFSGAGFMILDLPLVQNFVSREYFLHALLSLLLLKLKREKSGTNIDVFLSPEKFIEDVIFEYERFIDSYEHEIAKIILNMGKQTKFQTKSNLEVYNSYFAMNPVIEQMIKKYISNYYKYFEKYDLL